MEPGSTSTAAPPLTAGSRFAFHAGIGPEREQPAQAPAMLIFAAPVVPPRLGVLTP